MDYARNESENPGPVVSVRNLTKTYRLYDAPIDRLKESLHPLRRVYHRLHDALHDISFDLHKGESLGILGKNGAGKSTLLSIIYGLTFPTSGTVDVRGKVGLLNIGGNFNPDLSGVDNVFLLGAWFGLSRKQVEGLLDEIFAFADIGEYANQPVRTYSSGMHARLGFATNIFLDPDIFIIDEALSVGDARFQQKCLRKMNELIEEKKTFLFVSHSTESVKAFCNRVMWLESGRIVSIGPPEDVIPAYVAVMEHNTVVRVADERADSGVVMVEGEKVWYGVSGTHRMGNGKVEIRRVALTLSDGRAYGTLQGGEHLVFSMSILGREYVAKPVFSLHFHDSFGRVVFGVNSSFLGGEHEPLAPNAARAVHFDFHLPLLGNGRYTFTCGISEERDGVMETLDCSFDSLVAVLDVQDPQARHYSLRLYDSVITTTPE